jgi:hypothetical protein
MLHLPLASSGNAFNAHSSATVTHDGMDDLRWNGIKIVFFPMENSMTASFYSTND